MSKKQKKALAVSSTDWHLKEENIDQIKDLVRQQCALSHSLNVKVNFILGDIFHQRTGLQEAVLTAFSEILAIFHEAKIQVIAIPGNHDKQDYSSFDSFLESFKFHPGFLYVSRHGGLPMSEDGVYFHFLPFLKPTLWLQSLQDALEYIRPTMDGTMKHVLLSHTAVNGSVNNDGSKVDCNISVGDFKDFDLVLLGHYHNAQQVGKNVFHIPSIQQNNFGENTDKGFTVIYDDCSFELVKSKFKEYVKYSIDFDNLTKADLESLVKEHANANQFVRFEFTGASEKVKSINKEELSALGIDVKIKVKEIEDTIQYADAEIKEYTKTSIVTEFADFCEEKGKNFEEGLPYLTNKLK